MIWIMFEFIYFLYVPPTVILADWSISLNSGASPETSHLYWPDELALSFSSSTLQMNWLQCGEPLAMVTPLTGNQFVVGGVRGEYLQKERDRFVALGRVGDGAIGDCSLSSSAAPKSKSWNIDEGIKQKILFYFYFSIFIWVSASETFIVLYPLFGRAVDFIMNIMQLPLRFAFSASKNKIQIPKIQISNSICKFMFDGNVAFDYSN